MLDIQALAYYAFIGVFINVNHQIFLPNVVKVDKRLNGEN